MSTETYWLTLTAVMTSLFWIPYMIDRVLIRGIMGAFGNPELDAPTQSKWAERAMAAHRNAIENLVLFAIIVFVLELTKTGNHLTETASTVYFFTRLAHYFLQVFGVPILRTITFLIGWACFITMVMVAFKM